jgi:hypothetical protein
MRVEEWKLERYLLGELPPAELRRIEEGLRADPSLAEALDRLKAQHAALAAAHPSGRMAAGIRRRLERTQGERKDGFLSPSASRPGRTRAWAPALAALAILAVLPFTPFSPIGPPAPEGGAEGAGPEKTRLKGLEPRLLLYRKTNQGGERLESGQGARAGDLIQVHYESAGRSHGAIFSVDARGAVTRHFPEGGEGGGGSAALRSGGPVPLGFAYELDDAAGWEKFYFITADGPFSLDSVESALARVSGPSDTLRLPAGLHSAFFTLIKEPGT